MVLERTAICFGDTKSFATENSLDSMVVVYWQHFSFKETPFIYSWSHHCMRKRELINQNLCHSSFRGVPHLVNSNCFNGLALFYLVFIE